jgi:hypothetical protein
VTLHQLPGGELLQLFQAVPADARRLALLTGLAGEGFPDTLAWDPSAVFEGGGQGAGDTRAQLEQFIREQSARGRLLLGFLSYELGHQLHGLPLALLLAGIRQLAHRLCKWLDCRGWQCPLPGAAGSSTPFRGAARS